jgi:uncharacterized protein involved in outer membrane biogenesis
MRDQTHDVRRPPTATNRFVVYVATAANLAIAITKFVAAAVSGSSAITVSRYMLRMKAVPTKSIIAALVIAAIVLTIVFFNWNWVRGPVSSYMSAQLHRPFAINGDLRVSFGRTTLIQADDVVIANASWAHDNMPLAQVGQVAFHVDTWKLLRGQIVLPDIRLVKPQLMLERDTEGKGNWQFPIGAGSSTKIGALHIDDGVVHYRDPALNSDVTLHFASAAPQSGNSQPTIHFNGRGTLQKRPFTIEGRGAALLSLRETSKPYQVQMQAHAGATHVAFDGTFVPLQPQDVNGNFKLDGPDMSELYPIIPIPLPWTPAYRLSGHLTHQNDTWSFHRFNGKMGHSDLAGTVTLTLGGKRPFITGNVTSDKLDYKDLGGFVGIPPANQSPKEKKAAAQRQRVAAKRMAAKQAKSSRVLPATSYNVERLRSVDADVKFRGKHVIAFNLPFDSLSTHLELRNGVLKMRPLDFGVAGGHVVSNVTLDAHQPTIHTEAQIGVRNVELKRLFPKLESSKGSAGKFGGQGHVTAVGNSPAQMLGSMDGELALIMSGGYASTLILVLTNLDLARAAQLLIGGDTTSRIRCVVADFHIRHGKAIVRTLVADTSAVNIQGRGNVNFHDEQYDLHIKADSKKPSPLALKGPIAIAGTFKHPDVRPVIEKEAARVGAAIALGILATPLAALLPLIDLGNAENSDCGALIKNARKNVGKDRQRH